VIFLFKQKTKIIKGQILIFFKGLQLLCKDTTPALAHNMKSGNVHDFLAILYDNFFFPFNFFFIVVKEGKERK
jgi:hypothetical protein